MDKLRAYNTECILKFKSSPADFKHHENKNTPATKQKRYADGLKALDQSIDKVKHSFTIFAMVEGRADPSSDEGCSMCRDVLKDVKKFAEFGEVLVANSCSICLKNQVCTFFQKI